MHSHSGKSLVVLHTSVWWDASMGSTPNEQTFRSGHSIIDCVASGRLKLVHQGYSLPADKSHLNAPTHLADLPPPRLWIWLFWILNMGFKYNFSKKHKCVGTSSSPSKPVCQILDFHNMKKKKKKKTTTLKKLPIQWRRETDSLQAYNWYGHYLLLLRGKNSWQEHWANGKSK